MQIGMIGLGRMGSNMVRRLVRDGHRCVVHDTNPEAVRSIVADIPDGVEGAESISGLVDRLSAPRAVWIMVPAGSPTDSVVRELSGRMERGDVIVDGGNSYYKDDVRRAADLAAKGILYCDVGTSGGVWGIERG